MARPLSAGRALECMKVVHGMGVGMGVGMWVGMWVGMGVGMGVGIWVGMGVGHCVVVMRDVRVFLSACTRVSGPGIWAGIWVCSFFVGAPKRPLPLGYFPYSTIYHALD
jgi:hypothetical protein